MSELFLIGLLLNKTGRNFVSRILSWIFPIEEPIYHVYRRTTKGIPVPKKTQGELI